MSANIEALVAKHFNPYAIYGTEHLDHMRNALTEQAESFKGELQAYDGMVRELTKTVEDMRAVQSVPVVGEPTDAAYKWMIANGAEPMTSLHKLGERLAAFLDEDQFSGCETLLLTAITAINTFVPVPAAELATLREKAAMADEAHDVLRTLACELGAGGYNAEIVDASVFEHKIRDGVNMLLNPLMNRVSQAEQERDELRKDAEIAVSTRNIALNALQEIIDIDYQANLADAKLAATKAMKQSTAIAQGKGE